MTELGKNIAFVWSEMKHIEKSAYIVAHSEASSHLVAIWMSGRNKF